MKRALLLLLLAAAAPDPVVAVRGNDAITASQARALIAAADPDGHLHIAGNPQAVTKLVRDALLQHAILAQAKGEHWADKPEIAALIRRETEQVILQTYVEAHAEVPAGYPPDAAVQAAYEQNKAQLMQPRLFHLEQASIEIPPGAVPAARDTARRKLADIARAASRPHGSLAAAAHAVPGVQLADTGWQPENRLYPEARKAAAGLLEGQISEPFCTERGCGVVRLIATKPAGPAPLADARPTLVRALQQQKQREEAAAFETELLAHQPIQVNEIELSHLAPQPPAR